MNNIYINIKDVAEAKGLKSTRSLRLELNKTESKYISREVTVNGGTSYEILFTSLEPELQNKLRKNEKKSTALVPLNYKPPQFVSDNAKITANFRTNIVLALIIYCCINIMIRFKIFHNSLSSSCIINYICYDVNV